MTVSLKHAYAPYLLATAALLAAAVLIYPHDGSIFHALRSFSQKAGKFHLIREILEMFRPFGQGDVILMIAVGIGLCGTRRRALHIVIALAVMSVLVWPIKIGVGRERPAFNNFQSFPSGDAATAAAFVTPLAVLSPWIAPAGVLITGGVATERAYYGRHYASDVLAGAGLGVLAGAIALAILRRWRWQPDRRLFALFGFVILIPALGGLLFPRGSPYLLTVLRTWCPLGAFLMLTRLVPVWIRKHRTSVGQTCPWLIIIPSATVGGVLLFTPWFMPLFGLRTSLVAMGLIALFMARTLWLMHQLKRHEAIPATIFAGLTCLILTFGLSLLPALHAFRASILTF